MKKAILFMGFLLLALGALNAQSRTNDSGTLPVQPAPTPMPEWLSVDNGDVKTALLDAITKTEFADCQHLSGAPRTIGVKLKTQNQASIDFGFISGYTLYRRSDVSAQPTFRVSDYTGLEVEVSTDATHNSIVSFDAHYVQHTKVNIGTITEPNYQDVRSEVPYLTCQAR